MKELIQPEMKLRGESKEALPVEELIAQAKELGASTDLLHLMWRRGLREADEQKDWLQPRLAKLRKPMEAGASMGGFQSAVEIIADHIRRGSRIGIFGDYDVDGVTTAATLSSFIEAVGGEVVVRVATREAGYGFTLGVARDFVEAKVDLVLTGDCGTSDHEALGFLADNKVPCVVIDHHQVPDEMPRASALINPHQPDCQFPFKGMCSAGVAFYLVAALRSEMQKSSAVTLPDPRAWLDLVALGTICDLVPLVEENRILVHHGLRELGSRRRPGVRALLSRAKIPLDARIDEGHVGFQLGPRLNAPGRLASAEPSLELLRARSKAEADALAQEVEGFNSQRLSHQQKTVREALEWLKNDATTEARSALVVASDEWLAGVVGIAASGIVERYQRPTLAIAIDSESGEARGSARSVEGVDVRAALQACSALLRRSGGHKAAAGVSMDAGNVAALRDAFDSAVKEQLAQQSDASLNTALDYDGALSLEDLTVPMVSSIEAGGPYGMGFPTPLYLCENVKVLSTRAFKERHLSLWIDQAGHDKELTFFGGADTGIEKGDIISALFNPGLRAFGGRQKVQMRAERIWKS